ncbi:site-specific DNA-methyltransferase (adenine-specific) [Cupriavidus metallidurans]
MIRMEQIGTATLYCGDCRELLAETPRSHALIADPPYGINLAKLTGSSRNKWNMSRRTVEYDFSIVGDDKPFDPAPFLDFQTVVLFGGNHFGSRLPDASSWLVWDKRDGSTSDHQADCELAWTNLRGPARLYSHKWRGMVRAGEENVSRGGVRVHPTQKPVALMYWVIAQCKLPAGTVVFDPFMGSGTTGIAAARHGLPFVGVEIDPTYFDRACDRLRAEQEQTPLFA